MHGARKVSRQMKSAKWSLLPSDPWCQVILVASSGLWGSWAVPGIVGLVTEEAASAKSVSPLDSNTSNIPKTATVKRVEKISEPQWKMHITRTCCTLWRILPGIFSLIPLNPKVDGLFWSISRTEPRCIVSNEGDKKFNKASIIPKNDYLSMANNTLTFIRGWQLFGVK